MLESLEALGGLFLVFFVISLPFACFFIWISAKIGRIEDLSFGKILFAAIFASFITYLMITIFYIIPHFNTYLGFSIGIILSLVVIKVILRCTYEQAVFPWIFHFLAQILTILLGATLFIGGIKDFIRML